MAEMTDQEAAEWGKTLSFETVWTMLIKLGEKVDRTADTVNKMADKVDRVSENVGGLNRSVGELVETLIAA
jgi:methyl-accepting chemotaxis protein